MIAFSLHRLCTDDHRFRNWFCPRLDHYFISKNHQWHAIDESNSNMNTFPVYWLDIKESMNESLPTYFYRDSIIMYHSHFIGTRQNLKLLWAWSESILCFVTQLYWETSRSNTRVATHHSHQPCREEVEQSRNTNRKKLPQGPWI
jgi:hypothetical protein